MGKPQLSSALGRDDVSKRPGDAEGEFTKWFRGWALKSEASPTIRSWSKAESKNKVSVIQEDTSSIQEGMMKRMEITPITSRDQDQAKGAVEQDQNNQGGNTSISGNAARCSNYPAGRVSFGGSPLVLKPKEKWPPS
jgi:hypothetical protein